MFARDAALSHHWLGDESRDVVAGLVAEGVLRRFRASKATLWIAHVEETAVAVGHGGKGGARGVGTSTALSPRLSGDAQSPVGPSVEGCHQGDRLPPAIELLDRPQSPLDGFGAAVAEEGLLQGIRQYLRQLFGQIGRSIWALAAALTCSLQWPALTTDMPAKQSR